MSNTFQNDSTLQSIQSCRRQFSILTFTYQYIMNVNKWFSSDWSTDQSIDRKTKKQTEAHLWSNLFSMQILHLMILARSHRSNKITIIFTSNAYQIIYKEIFFEYVGRLQRNKNLFKYDKCRRNQSKNWEFDLIHNIWFVPTTKILI